MIPILPSDVFCYFLFGPTNIANDNSLTQHGEFGEKADITVYVYSVPKYSTSRWYKSNTQVPPSTKYVMSERPAIVNNIFHDKTIQCYVDHQRFKRIILQFCVYDKAVIRGQSNCTI